MDVAVVEYSNGAKSPDLGLVVGENYEIMLKESIERFLDQCRKGISDFSGFSSIFFRLLQARVNPPLEIIWFYSAVSFRGGNLVGHDPQSRVLMAKDLFQLLAACSASCDGLKSIAVLAPVLFELYQSVVDLPEKKLSSKAEKKVTREIEGLIEGIVSYISICCSKGSDEEDASVALLPCFTDLIRVWMTDRLERNRDVREDLRMLFPLVSEDILQGLAGGECVVGYLTGVVIVEAFLLRLCLRFRAGLSREELKKDLRTWAVCSVTGFRNSYFFVTLARMLLDPLLPVTVLLSSEDEAFLRGVLYDVVILVEYSFLNPENGIHLPADRMRTLAITRLIVAHEAIRVVKANGDHKTAISYINAFARSRLPSQLIRWATDQIGIEGKMSKPNVSTPQALIKWMLNLEDRGARVFDHYIAKFRPKLVLDMSKVDNEYSVSKPDSQLGDCDVLFYIDNKGEAEKKVEGDHEMMESMDAAFLTAAHTMKFTTNDRRRKQREGRVEGETQVKFMKYQLTYDSAKGKFPSSTDVDGQSSSSSEVKNPLSDEEMEETEL
ncbi:uncharacterized protein LOC122654418 [Telopea speciosissima]|uniref:uncharacterized protein LOC122654418 n=1 Tax=Telopea speciosissima TaxID=54955 RepID=UPI001CC3AE41|nr:uncharacterized protein LOC122654418 [Telopea speciosissima]XP_043704431.1 uncharacterized protein LOC122654418 [Telopea speciosissima]